MNLILCSGLLASTAFSLRNAGLAYYLSIYSALIIAPLLHILKLRTTLFIVLWFTIGSLPILTALFWRNLLLFEQIIPYHINRGHFSTLIISLRVFLESFLLDFSGSTKFSKLAWDIKSLCILGIPTFFIIIFRIFQQWKTYKSPVQIFIVFSFLSFFSVGSMLIIAHSYHGLDPGNLVRHVIPITWLVYPLLLIAINYKSTFIWEKLATILIGLILLFTHSRYIRQDMHNARHIMQELKKSNDIVLATQPLLKEHKVITSQIHLKLVEDIDIYDSIKAIPQNALIVSNAGGLLRRLTGRSVRSIDFSAQNLEKTISEIDEMAVQVGAFRKFYIVILPSNDIIRLNNAIHWKEEIIEKLSKEFTLTTKKQNIIVLNKT